MKSSEKKDETHRSVPCTDTSISPAFLKNSIIQEVKEIYESKIQNLEVEVETINLTLRKIKGEMLTVN